MEPIMRSFGKAPAGGWLQNAYSFILGQLFPAKNTIDPSEDTDIARGRLFLLQFLKALHKYENLTLPFDPTVDIEFLKADEVTANEYTEEYLHLRRLADIGYLYEFMRLGTELTLTRWDT